MTFTAEIEKPILKFIWISSEIVKIIFQKKNKGERLSVLISKLNETTIITIMCWCVLAIKTNI